MAVADTVRQYLETSHVYFFTLDLEPAEDLLQAAAQAQIPAASVVQAAVVRDAAGLVMAILPATHELDIDALSKLLRRKFEPATKLQLRAVFGDCAAAFIPPLPDAFGLRAVIDESLAASGDMYFPSGDRSQLVQITGKGFHMLQQHATIATGFTRPRPASPGASGSAPGSAQTAGSQPAAPTPAAQPTAKRGPSREAAALVNPPQIPTLAQELLRFYAHPAESVRDVVLVTESDPDLARAVIAFANTHLSDGVPGADVDTLQAAVEEALGPELAINFALGVSLAKPFTIPRGGPLGINMFWRHAIYTAALICVLGPELAPKVRPQRGIALLAGLIHNIGQLVLGHHLRAEFGKLTTRWMDNPQLSVTDLELETLGAAHDVFGASLAKSWRLPPEVAVAIREHHNPEYTGPHAIYAQLVLIADRLLHPHQMGDASTGELPSEVMKAAGLDEMKTLMVMDRVLEACESLNTLAEALTG